MGDLPGGEVESFASNVSPNSEWIVGASHSDFGSTTEETGFEAFVFDTASSTMVGLGDLPGGEANSVASSITRDGRVVVGMSSSASRGDEAFIWTASQGMRSLQDLLETQGLAPTLEGWVLREATEISADGGTITGWGINPEGTREAWVAVVPSTPSMLSGDFNADGFVGQGDLNLVLLNWGSTFPPAGFDAAALSEGSFDGLISQNELNDALLNWGNGSPEILGNRSTVPEPRMAGVLLFGYMALVGRRRLEPVRLRPVDF
ncbi:MAG: hypothetical protein AAF333_14965 [Planctomycetota bacterium]